jgi:hypothetical protein
MTGDTHVFAIGDVHGTQDLLIPLVTDCMSRSTDQFAPNGDISFIATVQGKRGIDVEEILPVCFGTWAEAEALSLFR